MSIQQRKHNIGWFSFNFCAIGADGKILDHFLVKCFNHWKERKLWYWQDLCKNIQAITSCNFTKGRKNLINAGTLSAVIEFKQGENLSWLTVGLGVLDLGINQEAIQWSCCLATICVVIWKKIWSVCKIYLVLLKQLFTALSYDNWREEKKREKKKMKWKNKYRQGSRRGECCCVMKTVFLW